MGCCMIANNAKIIVLILFCFNWFVLRLPAGATLQCQQGHAAPWPAAAPGSPSRTLCRLQCRHSARRAQLCAPPATPAVIAHAPVSPLRAARRPLAKMPSRWRRCSSSRRRGGWRCPARSDAECKVPGNPVVTRIARRLRVNRIVSKKAAAAEPDRSQDNQVDLRYERTPLSNVNGLARPVRPPRSEAPRQSPFQSAPRLRGLERYQHLCMCRRWVGGEEGCPRHAHPTLAKVASVVRRAGAHRGRGRRGSRVATWLARAGQARCVEEEPPPSRRADQRVTPPPNRSPAHTQPVSQISITKRQAGRLITAPMAAPADAHRVEPAEAGLGRPAKSPAARVRPQIGAGPADRGPPKRTGGPPPAHRSDRTGGPPPAQAGAAPRWLARKNAARSTTPQRSPALQAPTLRGLLRALAGGPGPVPGRRGRPGRRRRVGEATRRSPSGQQDVQPSACRPPASVCGPRPAASRAEDSAPSRQAMLVAMDSRIGPSEAGAACVASGE